MVTRNEVPQLIIPSKQNGIGLSSLNRKNTRTSEDQQHDKSIDNKILERAKRQLSLSLEECRKQSRNQPLRELFGLLELQQSLPSETQSATVPTLDHHQHKKFKRQIIESTEGLIPSDDHHSLLENPRDDFQNSVSLTISAFLSFNFVKSILQLARDQSSVHPVIVYFLSHPSTEARFSRFASSFYFLDWNWLKVSFNPPTLTHEYHPDQLQLLELVDLSKNGVSEAVECISRSLKISIISSLDLLLSFLLRRRLMSTLVIDINDIGIIDSSLLKACNLTFSQSDIDSVEWTSTTIRSELLSVLTAEFCAFLDSLSILVSLNILKPTFLSVEDDLTSRTLRFYISSATRQTRGKQQASKESIEALQQLALYVLQESIDYQSVYNSLWSAYEKITSTDGSVLDKGLESIVSERENYEEHRNISTCLKNGLCESSDQEFMLFQFRTLLELQSCVVSSLTCLVRYHPEIVSMSKLPHISEFVMDREFLGLVGDLLIRQENSTATSLIASSPSLLTLIRNLAFASSLFIVALHELYELPDSRLQRYQLPDPSHLNEFHDIFVRCDSRLDQPFSSFPSIHLQSISNMAFNIVLLAHSVFCLTTAKEVLTNKASSTFSELYDEYSNLSSIHSHSDTYLSSMSILWLHPSSSIPTLQSFCLQSTFSPKFPSIDSGPFSSSSALRIVLFDLIESILLSTELITSSSIHSFLSLTPLLFDTEECLCNRVLCPLNSNVNSNTSSSSGSPFWSQVVLQYLVKFIPYSFPFLFNLLTSLLPKDPLHPSSESRFISIISLLTNPISSICFAPSLASDHIAPLMTDASPPQRVSQRDSHSSISSYRSSTRFSVIDDQTWDWESYQLLSSLSLNEILTKSFGVVCQSDTHWNCDAGLLGRLTTMPIQLPSSLFFYQSPLHVQTDSSISFTQRRYCGSVWAVHSLTSLLDLPQSIHHPIDPLEFEQFDETFDAVLEERTAKNQISVSSLRGVISNPFKRSDDDQEPDGLSRLYAYESSCLSRGPRCPFTLEWDLTSLHSTPSILDLCWSLWKGLVDDIEEWNRLENESELILRINLLTSILELFNKILSSHPSSRLALERFLNVSFSVNSTDFQHRMLQSLAICIYIYKKSLSSSIAKSSSIRILILQSIDGLRLTSQRISLEDLFYIVSLQSNEQILCSLFSCWRDQFKKTFNRQSKKFQILDNSFHSISCSWYLRFFITSSTSIQLFNGKISTITFQNVFESLLALFQSNSHRSITLSISVSLLSFFHQLLTDSPPISWTLTPLEEALVSFEKISVSINQLMISHPQSWSKVQDYISQIRNEIHQVYISLSVPTFVYLPSISQSPDFSSLDHLMKFVFGIIWDTVVSSTSNWNAHQRLLILNSFLPVLNALATNLNVMNDSSFDTEAQHTSASNPESNHLTLDYIQEIRHCRSIQNCILQNLSGYNVIPIIMGLFSHDGRFLINPQYRTGNHSDNSISFILANTLLTQAHFHATVETPLRSNRFLGDSYSTIQLGQNVIRHYIEFMTTVLSITTSTQLATQHLPSPFFGKLRTSVLSLIWPATGSSIQLPGLPFFTNFIQLPTSDLFESLDRKLTLDLNFQRFPYSWTVPVNFALSLLHWVVYWGSSQTFHSLVLIRLLLSLSAQQSDTLKLFHQILIKLPDGLIAHFQGGTEVPKSNSDDAEVPISTNVDLEVPKSKNDNQQILDKTLCQISSSLHLSLQSLIYSSLIAHPIQIVLSLSSTCLIPITDSVQILSLQALLLAKHLQQSDPSLFSSKKSLSPLLSLIGSALVQVIAKLEPDSRKSSIPRIPAEISLTHQELILSKYSLLLLIQLLRNDSKTNQLALILGGPCPILDNINSLSIDQTHSSILNEIKTISFWEVLRRYFISGFSLWNSIESQRYSSNSIPQSDLYFIESINQSLALPTITHLIYGQSLVPSNRNVFGYSISYSSYLSFLDCSFNSLPLVVQSLNLIIQLVIDHVNRHSSLNQLKSILTLVKSKSSDDDRQQSSSLSRFPVTASELPHQSEIRAVAESSLLNDDGFTSLYKTITMSDSIAELLFKSRPQPSSSSTEINRSRTALILPDSSLLVQLSHQLNINLCESGLSDITPTRFNPPPSGSVKKQPSFINELNNSIINQQFSQSFFTVNHLTGLINLLFNLQLTTEESRDQQQCSFVAAYEHFNRSAIFDRHACYQFSLAFLRRHLEEQRNNHPKIPSTTSVHNAWINLLELISLASIELDIYRLKHDTLTGYISLLSVSRHAKIYPLILRPSSPPNESSLHKKPFRCFVNHVLHLLLICLQKDSHIWKNPSWISMAVTSSITNGNVSFGGSLIDFAILLLTANWEADCRAAIPLTSSPDRRFHPSSLSSFSGLSSSPPQRHDGHSTARRWRVPSDISDVTESFSRRGSIYEEGIKEIEVERLPRISMIDLHRRDVVELDNTMPSSCGCLSSTWQCECQMQPSICHPEGIWLHNPLCQLEPPIGSIDVLEIFNVEDWGSVNDDEVEIDKLELPFPSGHQNTFITPRIIPGKPSLANSESVDVLKPIQLFEQLVQTLFYQSINPLNQQNSIIISNPILNISDFCRLLSLLHVSVRFWIILHKSIKSMHYSFGQFSIFLQSVLDVIAQSLSPSATSTLSTQFWLQEFNDLFNLMGLTISKSIMFDGTVSNFFIPQLYTITMSSLFITTIHSIQSTQSRILASSSEKGSTTVDVQSLLFDSLSTQFVEQFPKLLSTLCSYRFSTSNTVASSFQQNPQYPQTETTQTPLTLLASRPIRIASIDMFSALSYRASSSFISLVTQLSLSHKVVQLLSQSDPFQLLTRLSGPVRYGQPIRLPTDASMNQRPSSSSSTSLRIDHWRPTYEFYPRALKQQSFSPSIGVLRSRSHIAWCQTLLCLTHLGRRRNGLSPVDSSIIVDTILEHQDRIHFVLASTKQTSQLALLEEFSIDAQLFAQLPSLHQIQSLENKVSVFRLAFNGLKSIRGFASLILGRGQIEIAEIFKPISIKELQSAGIHPNIHDDDESLLMSRPSSTVQVPSIFHQRIIVLTIKIISDLLKCFYCLSIDQLSSMDAHEIAQLIFRLDQPSQHSATSKIHSYNSTRENQGPARVLSSDLFEDIFHDVIDLGRLVLQLLEDLLKLERQVFIGIRTHSSNIILPLSLSLRCEDPLPSSPIPDSHRHITTFTRTGSSVSDSDINAITPCEKTIPHASSIDTPPPTPRLSTVLLRSIPSDSQTVISKRTSPLIQRYASGTPIKSSKVNRGSNPVVQFSKIIRINSHEDADLQGCLPEFIQISSLIKILQYSVESSLIIATKLFERLVEVSRQSRQPFERPSVIRLLNEFFTTVQGSALDLFKHRERLFKKMISMIGWTLGDEVKH